jgi:cytochrome c553
MKTLSIAIIGAGLLSLSGISLATGDVKAGKGKSAVCASCHGTDGKALNLVLALQAYRSKERQGGNAALMHAMAANLSDDDINNLAAYYASLK